MSRAIDLDGMDRAELKRTRRKAALYAAAVEGGGPLDDDGDDLAAIYDRLVAAHAAIRALPPEPPPVMAVVTVDMMGRIMPESTVTVGGSTWPVPEKAKRGGVMFWPRVGEVLREHGWRATAGSCELRLVPGQSEHVVDVPVERIEASDG